MKPNIPGRESNEAARMAVLWCIWRIERATRGTLGPNPGLVAGMIQAMTGRKIPHGSVLHYLSGMEECGWVRRDDAPAAWVKNQWRTTESGVDALVLYTETTDDPLELLRKSTK